MLTKTLMEPYRTPLELLLLTAVCIAPFRATLSAPAAESTSLSVLEGAEGELEVVSSSSYKYNDEKL
jgi:hypothetical protein